MRLHWALAALALGCLAVASVDAARFRGGRFSYRSFRSRSRFRIRTSYRGRGYRGPVYGRRLSPGLMGSLYFGYASRYPMYFNYRRHSSFMHGDFCRNNMALPNGSYVGTFTCPFLPDEPRDWTRCCGYENEGFCCDPDYNDSWKLAAGLTGVAIFFIVAGCLLAVGLAAAFLIYCCCFRKRGSSGGGGGGIGVSGHQTGNGYSEPGDGKQPIVGVSNPVRPPYPTMEYGTVQPQVGPGGAHPTSGAPYPPQPPPYPPPYEAGN